MMLHGVKPSPGIMASLGSHYLSHPLYKGLVGWWLFNEGGGLRAFDYSGNGHHAALTNMTLATAWSGGDLSLDGANDELLVGNPPKLQLSTGITVYARVLLRAYNGSRDQPIVSKWGHTSGLRGWTLDVDDATGELWTFNVSNDGAGWELASMGGFAINRWHDVVGTFDGADIKIYGNGLFGNSFSYSGTLFNTTTAVVFGFLGTTPTTFDHFNGLIRDIRIWDRALNASEIKQLYYNPYPHITSPLSWNFNAVAGSMAPAANQYFRRLAG